MRGCHAAGNHPAARLTRPSHHQAKAGGPTAGGRERVQARGRCPAPQAGEHRTFASRRQWRPSPSFLLQRAKRANGHDPPSNALRGDDPGRTPCRGSETLADRHLCIKGEPPASLLRPTPPRDPAIRKPTGKPTGPRRPAGGGLRRPAGGWIGQCAMKTRSSRCNGPALNRGPPEPAAPTGPRRTSSMRTRTPAWRRHGAREATAMLVRAGPQKRTSSMWTRRVVFSADPHDTQ